MGENGQVAKLVRVVFYLNKISMDNLRRYLHGSILGMCTEYLFMYKFSIYPLIIIIMVILIIIIDLNNNYKN